VSPGRGRLAPACLAVALALAGCSAPDEPPEPSAARAAALDATVERVVDGDTVRVRSRGFDDTVRLVGIDTPETRHPQRGVECFGPEATAAARRQLPEGRTVRLETDPTQATRDRYGRLLAHVYLGSRRGADSVNRALVASGHARVYVYRGVRFTHAAAFEAAERSARAAGRGLWGPPCRGGR
jgi:micrococcal nuclease